MLKWIIKEMSDCNSVAAEILKLFPSCKVFALHGTMGIGKTTLVKSFCRVLGINDEVVSPTFSIVNEYGADQKVFHFDLYRLRNSAELLDIGFEEYFLQQGYVFIEWPEMAAGLLPEGTTHLFMDWEDNNRVVQFSL